MKKIPEFVKGNKEEVAVGSLSEETLDTTNSFDAKLSGVSRRDFMRISKQYGLAATYAGVASMGGVFSAEALAKSSNTQYEKRLSKPAKHTLKLGTVVGRKHDRIIRFGYWEFASDLEVRTDGELRVDVLAANAICAEQVCVQKAMQGVIDIASSSTQNASSVAPWLNAIDFPYMFQSNGQLYHFFMSPKSDKFYRKVYR